MLVAEGKTNKEIAAEVFLSDKTVKNYVSSILSKLNLERRAQAAAFVAKHRADHPPEPRPGGPCHRRSEDPRPARDGPDLRRPQRVLTAPLGLDGRVRATMRTETPTCVEKGGSQVELAITLGLGGWILLIVGASSSVSSPSSSVRPHRLRVARRCDRVRLGALIGSEFIVACRPTARCGTASRSCPRWSVAVVGLIVGSSTRYVTGGTTSIGRCPRDLGPTWPDARRLAAGGSVCTRGGPDVGPFGPPSASPHHHRRGGTQMHAQSSSTNRSWGTRPRSPAPSPRDRPEASAMTTDDATPEVVSRRTSWSSAPRSSASGLPTDAVRAGSAARVRRPDSGRHDAPIDAVVARGAAGGSCRVAAFETRFRFSPGGSIGTITTSWSRRGTGP